MTSRGKAVGVDRSLFLSTLQFLQRTSHADPLPAQCNPSLLTQQEGEDHSSHSQLSNCCLSVEPKASLIDAAPVPVSTATARTVPSSTQLGPAYFSRASTTVSTENGTIDSASMLPPQQQRQDQVQQQQHGQSRQGDEATDPAMMIADLIVNIVEAPSVTLAEMETPMQHHAGTIDAQASSNDGATAATANQQHPAGASRAAGSARNGPVQVQDASVHLKVGGALHLLDMGAMESCEVIDPVVPQSKSPGVAPNNPATANAISVRGTPASIVLSFDCCNLRLFFLPETQEADKLHKEKLMSVARQINKIRAAQLHARDNTHSQLASPSINTERLAAMEHGQRLSAQDGMRLGGQTHSSIGIKFSHGSGGSNSNPGRNRTPKSAAESGHFFHDKTSRGTADAVDAVHEAVATRASKVTSDAHARLQSLKTMLCMKRPRTQISTASSPQSQSQVSTTFDISPILNGVCQDLSSAYSTTSELSSQIGIIERQRQNLTTNIESMVNGFFPATRPKKKSRSSRQNRSLSQPPTPSPSPKSAMDQLECRQSIEDAMAKYRAAIRDQYSLSATPTRDN